MGSEIKGCPSGREVGRGWGPLVQAPNHLEVAGIKKMALTEYSDPELDNFISEQVMGKQVHIQL